MGMNIGLLSVCLECSVLYVEFITNFVQARVDPRYLYCRVCHLAMTSLQHLEQHYMGRNHQRALEGQAPLKAGYFNKETQRWQR